MKVFKELYEKKVSTDFLSPLMGIDVATKPRGKQKYLDWDKVREIIKENPKSEIEVGLLEDFNNTGNIVAKNGKVRKEFRVYDNSSWATPVVIIDGTVYACYKNTSSKSL